MDINCTLLIQMVHFGIAYYLLRTFLFRPVIHHIDEDARYHHQIQKAIEERGAALLSKQQEKLQRWQSFQKESQVLIPITEPEQRVVTIAVPEVTYPIITRADIDRLKHESAHALVEKVEHVRP